MFTNHVHSENGCPICKSSKGEEITRKSLISFKVNFKREYRMAQCRNKNPLPFDFAILNNSGLLKGLIEFHGIQHFITISIFGGKNGFMGRQRNDQIKSDFCDLNRIPLLVIPYYDISKAEYLIGKFLKRIRNKKAVLEFNNPPQLTIF